MKQMVPGPVDQPQVGGAPARKRGRGARGGKNEKLKRLKRQKRLEEAEKEDEEVSDSEVGPTNDLT